MNLRSHMATHSDALVGGLAELAAVHEAARAAIRELARLNERVRELEALRVANASLAALANALGDKAPSAASRTWGEDIIDAAIREIQASRFYSEPVPVLLWCPECGERHVDVGEHATKPHHTHACQHCGHVWRPAKVSTVGVRFLPGFKDEESV